MDYGSPAPREMSFRYMPAPVPDGRHLRAGLIVLTTIVWCYNALTVALILG